MSSVINTNVMSLNAQRNLTTSQNMMAQALQRLSSGLRVNSAKDDAAGFAIAQRFETQIRGINMGIRNANDGISMSQTAESALGEITGNLQRIRELAIQSANGSYSAADQDLLQVEVGERLGEIDRIVAQTTFNGAAVLQGAGTISFQVGANANETVDVDLGATTVNSTGLGVNLVDVGSAGDAQAAIGSVDGALTTVATLAATLGASQNRLDSTVANLTAVSENLSASKSRIVDADFAAETANLTKAQILQQAGVAVLAQANAAPQSVLGLLR